MGFSGVTYPKGGESVPRGFGNQPGCERALGRPYALSGFDCRAGGGSDHRDCAPPSLPPALSKAGLGADRQEDYGFA